MSKNYSVARVEQHTVAGIGKSEHHIERKNESYENMNVDLSRTPLNVHFKGCGELTYNAWLDKLVAEGTVSLRGLKKDVKVFDEIPGYAKVRNGSILSKDMGIDTIIRECPHFREWIKQIAKQAEDTN